MRLQRSSGWAAKLAPEDDRLSVLGRRQRVNGIGRAPTRSTARRRKRLCGPATGRERRHARLGLPRVPPPPHAADPDAKGVASAGDRPGGGQFGRAVAGQEDCATLQGHCSPARRGKPSDGFITCGAPLQGSGAAAVTSKRRACAPDLGGQDAGVGGERQGRKGEHKARKRLEEAVSFQTSVSADIPSETKRCPIEPLLYVVADAAQSLYCTLQKKKNHEKQTSHSR